MADPLREKLRALVEEMGRDIPELASSCAERHQVAAGILRGVRRRLVAILDETEEPEACSEWRHCEHDGEDGHVACDVLCADCGMRLEAHPPKPLPLGHPHDALYHTVADAKSQRCAKCGQPREAHE